MRDDREPDSRGRREVRFVVLVGSGQRRAVRERAADGCLASAAVEPIPGVEIHADAAHDHAGASGHPPLARPHDLVELGGSRLRVGRTVDLAEEIAHRRAGALRAVRAAEALLTPSQRGEAAGVFQQHPRRVRHGEGVVRGDLQQQVAVGELRLQSVDRERRQGCEPARPDTRRTRHQARAESERDRQPGGREGELRLGVGERRPALREACRVVGEDAQQPPQSLTVGRIEQVEREEEAVRLRRGVDAGLVSAEERHGLLAVHRRRGGGGGTGILPVQGVVDSDRRGRADADDSSSEEELPPGRPGAIGARTLGARAHQWSMPSWSSPS